MKNRVRVFLRRYVIASICVAQALGMVGCKEEGETITTLCGKFSFSVADKKDASKARAAFYAANVRFQGLDFTDDRFTTSSKFIMGGQLFVLSGLDHYLNTVGDPPLRLQIAAYSTVHNTSSVQSTPCTFPNSAITFDNMKAAIAETWKVDVELESPQYELQRSATNRVSVQP